MTVTPAILDAMVASGCSAEQIAAVVKASMGSTNAQRRARDRDYFARILRTTKNSWERSRALVFIRDDFRCVYCGADVSAAPQCDHKIPLSLGGTNEIENLATACKLCNSAKSGMPFDDWMAKCR